MAKSSPQRSIQRVDLLKRGPVGNDLTSDVMGQCVSDGKVTPPSFGGDSVGYRRLCAAVDGVASRVPHSSSRQRDISDRIRRPSMRGHTNRNS